MTELKPKPEDVELPDGREWEDLPPSTRYYYRNREEEKERLANRKLELRKWIQEVKAKEGCKKCGEDDPRCLEFHHVEEKDSWVSDMIGNGYGKESVREEMEKCEILCANCHSKEHIELI